MLFFKGVDQGEGGKSFFKPKMTKVIKKLGGQGGEFLFFLFFFFENIFHLWFFLIGPLNKSLLETLQKWQKCQKCCFWHFKWDYPLNMPLSVRLGSNWWSLIWNGKIFFFLKSPDNTLKFIKKKKSWIRPSNHPRFHFLGFGCEN